jgi:PTS system arbutin-like IIC component
MKYERRMGVMMEKVQRFGGAMFTPAVLFAFFGIVVAIAKMLGNELIVGSIAREGTTWFNIWKIVENAGWTVFNQIELLFVVGLAIGLAKNNTARAGMEAIVLYLTFNYFIKGILTYYGPVFGIESLEVIGSGTGLKSIAGITTLDTNMLGAIGVSSVSVWLHNRYFEKKVPDWLGIFKGSSLVVTVGFFYMLVLAIMTCLVWPKIQIAISSLQTLLVSTGLFGIGLNASLERLLIPTGLHHFISNPIQYGPVLVEGGVNKYWLEHLGEFAASTESLAVLFPQGGYTLAGNAKIFGSIGIALSFYFTAKPSQRKKVLSIMLPVTITAAVCGITEPIEFTFLFIAPILFIVHSVLSGIIAVTMFSFGISGSLDSGLINMATKNWIPLYQNHGSTYLLQIFIGLCFVAVYFILFRFLIIKFNLKTPGREVEDGEIKLYSKKEYREKVRKEKDKSSISFAEAAVGYIEALGGAENIETVMNCASRLRIGVEDENKVSNDDEDFKKYGAYGMFKKGKAVQIIIGTDVQMVKSQIDKLLEEKNKIKSGV